MITDIALITLFEKNRQIINESNQLENRYYEQELITCIKYWRAFAKELKNINIYVLNLHEYYISKPLRSELHKYNAKIIDVQDQQFKKTVANISNGFLFEPLCGKYFEQFDVIPEHILIKIDLDMMLIKSLPMSLVEFAKNAVVIGQYDKYSLPNNRDFYSNDVFPLSSDFIIVNKQLNFYTRYFDLCVSGSLEAIAPYNQLIAKYGNYFLDELVLDYLFQTQAFNFMPVQYYQYCCDFKNNILKQYTKQQLKKICFLHSHIYSSYKISADNALISLIKLINSANSSNDQL